MGGNARGSALNDVAGSDQVAQRLAALEAQVASLRALVGELLALYDEELRRDGG
jgi:hypothetical protein